MLLGRTAAALAAAGLLVACRAAGPPSGGPATTPSPVRTPSSSPATAGEARIIYQWGSPFGGDGIFVMHRDGSQVQQVVDPNKLPGTLDVQSAEHPDWSPDGRRFAFTAMEPNSSSVWVAQADGSQARRVLGCGDGCGLDEPVWSPDGRRLAVVQLHAEAGQEGPPADTAINVIDLASGEVSTVVRARLPRLVRLPSWSPDGRRLVYDESRFTGTRRISSVLVIASRQGRASHRITDPDMFASFPDWSPTVDRIVFATYDIGAFPETTHASNLFTVRADGSELRQVTHEKPGGARVGQPSWTPDGSQVLATVVNGDTRRLAFVTPATGRRTEIPDVDATWGRLEENPPQPRR